MAADLTPAMVRSSSKEEFVQEASLHASLARLQEMHVALRRLRDTIPRVVTSIQTADLTPGPAELYSQFSHAATAAGKDIKEFMQMMGDDRAKEVFEQVNKSREADGEGIEGWRVTEHEDWLDVKKEMKEGTDGVEEMEGPVDEGQHENREKAMEAFRAVHPEIEVLSGDILTIKLPPPASINFFATCTRETSRQDGMGLDAKERRPELSWKIFGITNSIMKETKFTKSILDAITASEFIFNDLGSILEMVASYSDVSTRPCAKCSRPIDRTGQLPIVRNRKRTKQADGRYVTQWLAFHKACT